MPEQTFLDIRHLDAGYGRSQVLFDVNIGIPWRGGVAVLGRNGAGKTTLMKTIIGELPAWKGEVAFDGRDISRLAPYDRARQGIAFVPQGREIFPLLTVKENLETGFAPCKRADRYVPAEIYDLFPVLKDMLGRRGGDLSGGQQQQLAIGRALVTRPRVLVLDEPTEGIQPSIIKDIGRAIDYLRGKGDMAIVLVEQYFEWARDLCDTYAVMDRGQVVEAGPRSGMVEAQVRRWLSV